MADMLSSAEREQRLERTLADYLHAVEAGTAPDRARLLEQHPDLAGELRSFFRNRDAIERMAEPIKQQMPEMETVAPEGARSAGVGSTIRYFGDYELLEEIARGGMGVVYKARQASLNRVVALKMILAGQLASPEEVTRFHTEAEAAGNLDHPNIVHIYEVGEHQGQHYFSMRLVAGSNLSAWTKGDGTRLGKEGQRKAAEVVAKVARAVHHAHQRGILHRDLKPGNILIDEQGQPHVTDFGLAKRVEGDSALTRSGAIVGTPSYMAPEQARSEKVLTTGVDVYSLGAILYELLTGRPPFRAETPLDTVLQVLDQEPLAPRSLCPTIDRDLETICLKCLHKEAARRYESAAALADDLERWLRGEPINARPVKTPERLWRWCRRNPLVAGLSATVVVLLAMGIVVSSILGLEAAQAATVAGHKATEAEEARARADDEARKAVLLAADEKKAREVASASESKAKQSEQDARTSEQRALDQEKQTRLEKERGDRQLRLAELRLYAGQLAQAQREWQDGNGARALQVLDRCQWDLRDLEFRLLWTLYTSNQLTLPGQRTQTCVAFSPDGKHCACGSWFDGLQVWDLQTRKSARIGAGFDSARLNSVAFSPDGSRLVCGCGKVARVFDVGSGQQVLSLQGHMGDVSSVAWSPDQKRIVSGSQGPTLKVWDAGTGRLVHTLKGHPVAVTCVAFSPDSQRIVSGSSDKTLKIWNAATGQEERALAGHTAEIISVAFSPDGQQLVSGSEDNTVKIWNAQTGQELLTLKGHRQPVRSVAVSPDGTRIVSGSEDGTVRVWHMRTGREAFTLTGHMGAVTGVAISPDGRYILSCGLDHTLKIWDANKGQQPRTFKGHTESVRSVAVRADGKQIVSGSDDGTLKVWEADNGSLIHTLKGHKGAVASVAFGPDGKRIVSGSWDGTLKVWDSATGKELLGFKGGDFNDAVNSVGFSPDGKRIVSSDMKVWDAATGKLVLALPFGGHQMAVSSVAFSPDGKQIVTASFDWALKLWDASSGKEVRKLTGHRFFVNSAAFSPDGKRIVSGSRDNTLKLWDAHTGQDLLTLRGHTRPVHNVASSPDGKRIISLSKDDTLKIWDAVTGQSLLTLHGLSGGFTSVALSADGQRLVTGRPDGAVQVWDAWNSQIARSLAEDDMPASSMVFTPDSRRLVVGYGSGGNGDGYLKVWDLQKGEAILSVKGHANTGVILAVSPDGKRIATSGGDMNGAEPVQVELWDIDNGKELLALKGLKGLVIDLAFSADGKQLSGKDSTDQVLTWDAVTGKVLPDARPPKLEYRIGRRTATSPDRTFRAGIDETGIKVVCLPATVEARLRQQDIDRTFLERLVRPDAAYHRQQADACEKTGDLFAAAFHLRRLLVIDPKDTRCDSASPPSRQIYRKSKPVLAIWKRSA